MKKIISLLLIMSAFVFSTNAQTEYFVISTPDRDYSFDISGIDSILVMDRAQLRLKADTIIDISVQLPADATEYATTTITLPAKKVYSLFGYATPMECINAVYNNEVYFYFYDNITKEIYSETHSMGTANDGGCWFDADGSICAWGNSSMLFIEPALSTSKMSFNLGQYPGRLTDGEEYTLYMGLQNGETYVAFRLNITIGEVVQEAFTYDTYLEIDETGGNQSQYDIDTTGLCEAFGKSYEELMSGLGDYSITFYPVNADGTIDKSEVLLDLDGYWFTAEGEPCASDNEAAAIKMEPTYDKLSLFITQAPYACTLGDVITLKFPLSTADADAVITLNITVVEEGFVPEGAVSDGHNNFVIHMNLRTSFAALKVALDGEAIAADLGYATVDEVLAAMGSEITFVNLNADLSDGTSTANQGGAWYNAEGNTCSWGSASVTYSEPTVTNFAGGLIMSIGMYPGQVASGDVYTMNQKFKTATKESFLKFELHLK